MILSLHAQAQLFLLTVLLGGGMGLFMTACGCFAMPFAIMPSGCRRRMGFSGFWRCFWYSA